ncbi:MAG TPA: alkaline phosphatase D family protein, partial [Pseudonocardiaceae bacterium]|nr:alkaline phosphatase D family protein [Pseudonocardiaceae bacterium]
MSSDSLLLGPLLRYVDETAASVWVETRQAAQVTVAAAGQRWTAATFAVHGHHYALVEVDGLAPGSMQDYTVQIDDATVWPPADSPYPPSRIATLDYTKPLRIAFGSCRTSVPHDKKGNRTHGVDALRAYAMTMASGDHEKWPDRVLFLGDQVYADETSDAMQEFIASRRDIDEPPGEELKDFEEYTHLYKLAWTDPANRWLLSTLPSSMIFDDHDVRDDWNTSATERQQMAATSWWQERIVGALSSYWVYQHIGNLSTKQRNEDPIWQLILAGRESSTEVDVTEALDQLADRADKQPDSYRWSYSHDLGDTRVIVVDSRAARILAPDQRSMLDPQETKWLDEHLRGGFDHVLIGTSLPFLLSPGLHNLEAWSEAVAEGAWGKRAAKVGERLRQGADFEHWAAFQEGFQEVAAMVLEVAEGKRGDPPATVTFLSGDVHHSYLAEVERGGRTTRILQAVCSPIRNPLPRAVR